jgi:hypothetical protein
MAPEQLDLSALDEIPDPAPQAVRRLPPEPAPPAEPSLTRAAWRRRLWTGLGMALLWVGLFVWKTGLRPDFASVAILGELALWSVTAGLALAAALHPGRRGVSLGVRTLVLTLIAVPVVFLTCALVWSMGAAPIPLTWANSRGCLALGTFMGLGPLGVALYLFRHAFVAAATWRLALLGAVCGLAGTIGCQAHCPLGDAFSHVAIAHGMPILVGAVTGAIYGALRGRA